MYNITVTEINFCSFDHFLKKFDTSGADNYVPRIIGKCCNLSL